MFSRQSYSKWSYFPPVWFAHADDSHLTDEEQDSGGILAKSIIKAKQDKERAAFKKVQLERLDVILRHEQRIESERTAKIEAERLAESERVAQENERLARIEAYRAIVPVQSSPVIVDIQQNIVKISPELSEKLALIAENSLIQSSRQVETVAIVEPDYSDEIALIMILLEAA